MKVFVAGASGALGAQVVPSSWPLTTRLWHDFAVTMTNRLRT
jgi:hypothetical protein